MITKGAENINNFKQNVDFTNSAREAWELILNTIDSYSKILLPSYIGITDREGSGIYDPVMKLGNPHDFYFLNSDLTIDLNRLEIQLKRNHYKLILLVHYFGYKIDNIVEVVRLCKHYNLLVVEDCAHLYNYSNFNISDAGLFGDFTFYSLHKFFPIKSGGLLMQNNSDINRIDCSKIVLKLNYDEKFIAYNSKEIVNKRIENFRLLHTLIVDIPGIKPLKTLKKGDIPHTYPVIVENGLREKLYFWMIKNEITLIALYYRLINPLQQANFYAMVNLSNNILNLPIHQDIEQTDLVKLVAKMKKFYE